MRTPVRQIYGIVLLCFCLMCSKAQAQNYTKTEAKIPMRDGVHLNTSIFRPDGHSEALPFLMIRTPYGIEDQKPVPNIYLKELADEGYIFVFQDVRGRYGSEGKFNMEGLIGDKQNRSPINESTDTYDTIDWLLKNVPNNSGRVGMLGISYDGDLAVLGTIGAHPALKAISPQAPADDLFLNDDFHHNGAFRLSYGFEYAAMMETNKVNTNFRFDTYDTYLWYLRLGPLSNANARYLHNKIPTWNDFVAHPNYDDFWQHQAISNVLDKVTVPVLNVAGWFDQEDQVGPQRIYNAWEKYDTKHQNYIVIGPWNHGGWARPYGNKLGKIDFGFNTALYFREEIQAPWFAYWLKDKGAAFFPEARTFRTGSNIWESYPVWPPKQNIVRHKLYLRRDGALSYDPPTEIGNGSVIYDQYISDPARPIPYRPRPIEATYDPRGSGWYTWLLDDQRFVQQRPDVLSWETEPLKDDVVVTGRIWSRLCASTSGTDSDWIVKLIDVYPEDNPADPKLGGYQLMIASEVMRARFRNSFSNPTPVKPDEIVPYTMNLHTTDHAFLKGHRIMVQVQSTWFPVIDRNPQTFVPNIFLAKESDYRPATQRVYHSLHWPSYVELPILEEH